MNSFLKKQGLTRLDLFYLAALTLIGLSIRVILRVVITDDWLMYWDPWISDIKERGFSYLATDRYDYTPTFIYILWVISKLPMNPMTAYKGLHCILDFVAAAILGKMIYKVTGSRRKGVLSYGLFLIVPTIWANSALWAQCDIIFMTFLLLCFYYLFADRPCRAMFFYGMAFVFKLQSLFIFPFLVILWVNKKVDLKHFLWIPALYFLSIVPAWIAGRPLMSSSTFTWPRAPRTCGPCPSNAEHLSDHRKSVLPAGICFRGYLADPRHPDDHHVRHGSEALSDYQ